VCIYYTLRPGTRDDRRMLEYWLHSQAHCQLSVTTIRLLDYVDSVGIILGYKWDTTWILMGYYLDTNGILLDTT